MSSFHRAPIFWLGLDVHKDSVTAAVFRDREPEALRVDLGRRVPPGRSLADPRRPGEHRKTDRRDAIKIARDFRDDRLVLITIPSEEDERVRDLVRCRETFQREIVKSRHYILKFMRRRGFVFREGAHWTVRHFNWIRQVLQPGTLADQDRTVLAEYLALLEYKLQRRDDLDARIQELALTPRYRPVVDRLCCFRGFKTQAAMVLATELGDVRRFESPRQSWPAAGQDGECESRARADKLGPVRSKRES